MGAGQMTTMPPAAAPSDDENRWIFKEVIPEIENQALISRLSLKALPLNDRQCCPCCGSDQAVSLFKR
jgi:hypothetical protein